MVSIELTPDPIKTVHYVLQNLQQREESRVIGWQTARMSGAPQQMYLRPKKSW